MANVAYCDSLELWLTCSQDNQKNPDLSSDFVWSYQLLDHRCQIENTHLWNLDKVSLTYLLRKKDSNLYMEQSKASNSQVAHVLNVISNENTLKNK